MAKQKYSRDYSSSDPFPPKFNADRARNGIDPTIITPERFDRGLDELDKAMNKQADLPKK